VIMCSDYLKTVVKKQRKNTTICKNESNIIVLILGEINNQM